MHASLPRHAQKQPPKLTCQKCQKNVNKKKTSCALLEREGMFDPKKKPKGVGRGTFPIRRSRHKSADGNSRSHNFPTA